MPCWRQNGRTAPRPGGAEPAGEDLAVVGEDFIGVP
jgi:hypothetical protein